MTQIVRNVVNDAPEVLDHAGFDWTNAFNIVLGHIGMAQATMTQVTALPNVKADPDDQGSLKKCQTQSDSPLRPCPELPNGSIWYKTT